MMTDLLKTIQKLAGKNEVYIVGGWLRDKFLKRANKDLDLATSDIPSSLARKTARALGGSFVVLDKTNKIFRVVLKDTPGLAFIDFAKFKGATIIADIKKRDFTVNAIAAPIDDPARVIDPLGGRADLKEGRVRMTGPKIFSDDPLRLLRAFRIAAELKFSLDPATLRLIKKNATLIKRSAAERIREELFRILALGGSNTWIHALDSAGLLDEILPEIGPMKKAARKFYFHPRGLWQHSMETLSSLETLLERLPVLFPEHHSAIRSHLDTPLSQGVTRKSLLKIVAMMHDVAKPDCAARIGKRMRFLGHESKGAKMAGVILKRMRLARPEIGIAQKLIEHHMRPISLGQAPALTERAFYRIFKEMGDNLPDLVLLSLADCYSYRRIKMKKTVSLRTQEIVMKETIRRYYTQKEKPVLPKLIDGNVLMSKFSLKPGPIIGRLLKGLAEAQALGKITTSDQALLHAGKLLTRLKK